MTENDKTQRLLIILRKSKPLLDNPEDIGEKVMERIRQIREKQKKSPNIFDFLFSWVYVVWVRRCLIAASIIILIVFGYQQTMILKRINNLDARTISNENLVVRGSTEYISDKLLLYKITENKPFDKQITVTEKQINRLIESINELQIKYNDLIKLIEENPDLKKIIDEKMTKSNREKLKL